MSSWTSCYFLYWHKTETGSKPRVSRLLGILEDSLSSQKTMAITPGKLVWTETRSQTIESLPGIYWSPIPDRWSFFVGSLIWQFWKSTVRGYVCGGPSTFPDLCLRLPVTMLVSTDGLFWRYFWGLLSQAPRRSNHLLSSYHTCLSSVLETR